MRGSGGSEARRLGSDMEGGMEDTSDEPTPPPAQTPEVLWRPYLISNVLPMTTGVVVENGGRCVAMAMGMGVRMTSDQ